MKFEFNFHVHEHAGKDMLAAIETLRGEVMKQFADLKAALAAIDARTTDLSGTVDVVVSKENEQLALIQALKDQIAAGTPVTQEQLDEVTLDAEARVTRLTAVSTALKAIAADPNQPVPEPEPGEGEGGEGGEGNGDAGTEGDGAIDGSVDASSGNGSVEGDNGGVDTARPASMERKSGIKESVENEGKFDSEKK